MGNGVEHIDPEMMMEEFRRRGHHPSRYVYPPGTYFAPHTHPMDKYAGVISGRFRIVLEGEAVVLGPGDFVFVPAGALHDAAVVGDEPVVSVDAPR